MIAARNPIAVVEHRGVNVILRRDGTEVALEEIVTAAEGQAILDELDAALLAIEDQLDDDDGRDGDWRRRAQLAHKRKRRQRPRLQQRIGELRKAEQRSGRATPIGDKTARLERSEQRRTAFINAAESMLDRHLFVTIWLRASENEPEAFEGWEGVQA